MSQSSKWNIWDFHLHTPCSILNNSFGCAEDAKTWDTYVSQIAAKVQEKGITAREHPTFAKILAARQDRGVRLGTPSHDSQRD